MDYIYQFDVAAIALTSLVFLIYVFGKNYPTRTRTVFLELMVCTLVAAALDIAFNFTMKDADVPVWVNYIIKALFLISDNFCVQFFYLYVLSVTKGGGLKKISAKANRIFAVCTMAFIAILIGTTPFTHFIFYFENGAYVRGGAYLILHTITAVSLVYSVVIFFCYRTTLSRFQIVAIATFISGVIGSVVFQLFFPEWRLSLFASSLGTVLLYASLEKPSDYMYKNTGCYNKSAFFDYIYEHAIEKFHVVIIRPNNADYLGRMLSPETWGVTVNNLINDLHIAFGRKNVFHLDGLCFAVITRGDPQKEVISRTVKVSSDENETASNFQFCILPFPELSDDMNRIRETVNHVIHNPQKYTDTVYTVTPGELAKSDREIMVLNAVRRALSEGLLQVYYQPIFETKTGRFASAEALIRLNDKNLGFISPEEFIPVAEQNGLIIQVGEFVFDSVCSFWCKNNLADMGVSFIEINLSTLQCIQRNLSTRLVKIMNRHGIDTRCINLEITETASAANHAVMLKNMQSLIGVGASFSLDDYGTGYSNIDYLISLPVEIVKIDKSILWKAMENENSKTILVHTLKMMHDLGMKTVAEGVETQEMVDLLQSVGCDYYQGFLFSRPLPPDEYLEFIKRRSVG
ncbi:MAG: EAL domain-containing protein [Clostridia bacterium]|nr:EAL domain-containing protein [Clostridia bacterium]